MGHSKRWAGTVAGLALLLVSNGGGAGVGDFLSDVGRAVGKPFGGFVESLITPSLRAVNNTLVADVDRRLEQRIEQVNRSAGDLLDQTDAIVMNRVGQVDSAVAARITQVDLAVAARFSQADGIMAARIAQIGATGDRLIDRAIGKLDGTLDKNIRLVGIEARKTIGELDKVGKERLKQIDGVLETRVNQLQGVVHQAVVDVDQALEQRLEQVDEISERRIGNLDVIGTRQILNLESMLTRLAGLAATLTLVVIMLYSLGRELWDRWEKAPPADSFLARISSMADRKLAAGVARVLFAHALLLVVSLGVVMLVSRNAPREIASREQALLGQHRDGFETSNLALDYRGAIYQASQLAIIEPATASQYDLRIQKLKLIRDTLVRPGILERPETVRNLARQIATLDGQFERREGHADPDLLTLQCYIRWQLAADRLAESIAAADCRKALDVTKQKQLGSAFLLLKLARHYVDIQRFFPAWSGEPNPTPTGPAEATEPMPGFEHVHSYDTLVQALDESSTNAYLALLDAHLGMRKAFAELGKEPKPLLEPASDAKAQRSSVQPGSPTLAQERVLEEKRRRLSAARQVVAAWQAFDSHLTSDEWITGTTAELGVFLLNDAILTRALFVVAAPDAEDLPGKIKDIADPLVRIRVAPPRIEWMRRYLGWVGDNARRLSSFEEARRFSTFEDQVIAFEQSFFALKLAASPDAEQRLATARAAAQLALYIKQDGHRVPLARVLVDSDKLDAARQGELSALVNLRRVRLL